MKADLAVVGAGPAGAAAASEAARCGLSVVLLDQAHALQREISLAGVRTLFGHQVWSVSPGFDVQAIGPKGSVTLSADRLVAATGGVERVVPFPGWTLPGVTGLVDPGGMAPGRRVVVAGCGPLLAAVAATLAAGGMMVVAVVDVSSRGEWARARPVLRADGTGWALKLARRRVPVLFRHAVRRAEGAGGVQRIEIGPVDSTGRPMGSGRWLDVDALCVGHGFTAGSEIPRLLRAPHRFAAARGGWVPLLDQDGRTGIPGLYAAGDAANVAGSAATAGRLAGLAAAADAGRAVPNPVTLRRSYRRSLRHAIASRMQPPPGLLDAIPAETIICRCEDVTRGDIEYAIDQGAREVNQLKHFTRCGMGPCQGRLCGDIAAELMARRVGSRQAAGRWSMRPPLQPVPLDILLGDFEYSDIPVPKPAPL